MKIELRNFSRVEDRLNSLARGHGLSVAAEAGATLIRDNMINIINQTFNKHPQGVLGNPKNWPVHAFSTPEPGAQFGTSLKYAARLNYSPKYGSVNYLSKSVAASRERLKPTMVEAWRRERGR